LDGAASIRLRAAQPAVMARGEQNYFDVTGDDEDIRSSPALMWARSWYLPRPSQ